MTNTVTAPRTFIKGKLYHIGGFPDDYPDVLRVWDEPPPRGPANAVGMFVPDSPYLVLGTLPWDGPEFGNDGRVWVHVCGAHVIGWVVLNNRMSVTLKEVP